MTKSLRRKRRRRDLRIAARSMPMEGVIQFPSYATGLFRVHRYKILYGGRGGARSWSVARALLIRAAQKRTRILCTREMQSSLRDSVHQLLRDQIDLLKLTGFIVTDREIRHVNGSLFLFEGLRHNITKIKSLEGIDICWVEEAERISNLSWRILIPTIRKPGSEIWITFNPDQEEDATYQRFVAHKPKDCWIKKVNWQDNPWLTDELRAEKDYDYEIDPEAAEHTWGGDLREISEKQILRGKWSVQEFSVPFRTNKDGEAEPVWNGPYQGCDFGFGVDPFAAIRCWTHDKILYIEHEVYRHHLDLDDTPSELVGTIQRFEDYITRADSARPDSISHLKQHGIPRIIGAKKGPGSVEDGIAHLRSYRSIIIHPRCIHTKAEFKAYSYKVDQNSGDVLPIIVDKHNHLVDSLRYALEPLIKPQRRVGFVFVDEEARAICPSCESYLPDDGECPHCGWTKEPEDEVVPRDVLETVHKLMRGPKDADTEVVAAEVGANGNGNGNGAHHPSTPLAIRKPIRMRDLNA